MKKIGIRLAVLCLIAALTAVGAGAANVSGLQGNGATVTPQNADGQAVAASGGAYSGVSKFEIAKSGADANQLYLVVICAADGDSQTIVPTESNSYYMNIAPSEIGSVGADGTLNVTAYPKDLADGKYLIGLSDYADGGKLKTVASFTVGASAPASDALTGNFDGIGDKPDVSDVVSMIDLIVSGDAPTAQQLRAADFDGDGKITVGDVVSVISIIVS